MIDLRKNKSKFFWVNKKTLEVLDGAAHIDINHMNMTIMFFEIVDSNKYKYKNNKINYKYENTIKKYKKFLNRFVKITRDEYKEFRKMDDDCKKLYIELKEE